MHDALTLAPILALALTASLSLRTLLTLPLAAIFGATLGRYKEAVATPANPYDSS